MNRNATSANIIGFLTASSTSDYVSSLTVSI